MPAFSTVHNLMARHGLLPGASPGIPATGRFEHDAPNRLWQMDFKGHFPFGGGRCHPLTLLDDHSRFPCAWRTVPMNGARPCSSSWSACLSVTACRTG